MSTLRAGGAATSASRSRVPRSARGGTNRPLPDRGRRPPGRDDPDLLVSDYPEWEAIIQAGPGVAGVDILIGRGELTGEGLGPRILAEFAREVVTAASVIATVEEANRRSWRAFEKAGFHHVRNVERKASRTADAARPHAGLGRTRRGGMVCAAEIPSGRRGGVGLMSMRILPLVGSALALVGAGTASARVARVPRERPNQRAPQLSPSTTYAVRRRRARSATGTSTPSS